MVFSHSLLIAEDIYSELGIAIQQKRISLQHSYTNRVDITEKCKLKKIYKKRLSSLFKHLKSQKLSEEVTHYGVEVKYKLSKQIQLTIDVLADLDIRKPSKIIKDQQANIRLAISL